MNDGIASPRGAEGGDKSAGRARTEPFDDGRGFIATSFLGKVDVQMAKRWWFREAEVAPERAMVSFSFDDFPLSAHATGAAMLEAHGARGTFYAATGLCGLEMPFWTVAGPDEIVDLHGRGHEIGLHTHCHRPIITMSPAAFEADLAANRAALRRLLPGTARETFAYPFGYPGWRQKRRLARLVRASRSVTFGLNLGRVDPDFLKAVELVDRRISADTVQRLLDETAQKRAWLIFTTHDIAGEPSPYGASPALFEAAVAGAVRRGIDILPVSAALDRIGIA